MSSPRKDLINGENAFGKKGNIETTLHKSTDNGFNHPINQSPNNAKPPHRAVFSKRKSHDG